MTPPTTPNASNPIRLTGPTLERFSQYLAQLPVVGEYSAGLVDALVATGAIAPGTRYRLVIESLALVPEAAAAAEAGETPGETAPTTPADVPARANGTTKSRPR
jgi:hypothetical protein